MDSIEYMRKLSSDLSMCENIEQSCNILEGYPLPEEAEVLVQFIILSYSNSILTSSSESKLLGLIWLLKCKQAYDILCSFDDKEKYLSQLGESIAIAKIDVDAKLKKHNRILILKGVVGIIIIALTIVFLVFCCKYCTQEFVNLFD